MTSKYFGIPFATSGDKSIIPDASQPNGDVSYEDGWTPDYAKDQTTDANAKDVSRQSENSFKFDVTDALKEIQEVGSKPYDPLVNYPVGALIPGSDGDWYRSFIKNGPAAGFLPVKDPVGDETGTWFNESSKGTSFKNKLINGNFSINQEVVSGAVILASGEYGHDMFKAGAGGCTYDFATLENVTTITISTGSLLQIIKGCNLQSGVYTLSWIGTVQGKINTGAYSASGVKDTIVGGVDTTIEFNIGTLSKPQFELSTVPTVFEEIPKVEDLQRCQYYFKKTYDQDVIPGAISDNGRIVINSDGVTNIIHITYNTWQYGTMASIPTIKVYSPETGAVDRVLMNAGDVLAAVPTLGDAAAQIGGTDGVASTTMNMNFHATADARP